MIKLTRLEFKDNTTVCRDLYIKRSTINGLSIDFEDGEQYTIVYFGTHVEYVKETPEEIMKMLG